MPVYRRMCHYNICIHLLFLFALQSRTLCTCSILNLSLENINPKLRPIGQFQRVKPGKACMSNTRFTVISMCILAILTLITWLSLLLLCSGDIQPNPGPPAWTGDGGCQQRQVLGGGYLQQPQLEHSCGQNHSQCKQVSRIY